MPFAIATVVFFVSIRSALLARSFEQLVSVRDLLKAQVENYLGDLTREFERVRLHPEFAASIRTSCADCVARMAGGIVRPGVRDLVLLSADGASYQVLHGKGLSPRSAVASPVLKQVFQEGRSGFVAHDFSRAPVEGSGTLGYLAGPVRAGDRDFVLLLSLTNEELSRLLEQRFGLGHSGETYIIGPDHFFRTRSRFIPQSDLHSVSAGTEGVKAALAGKTDNRLIQDYRDIPVLSSFARLTVPFGDWAILAEIDEAEVLAPMERIGTIAVILSIVTLFFILGMSSYLADRMTQRIRQVRDFLTSLGQGRPVFRRMTATGEDEIADMSQAANALLDYFAKIHSFAGEVGRGDFMVEYRPLGAHDELGNALIRMRDELRCLSEAQVASHRMQARLMIEAQEDERRRIAQELHDGLGQVLTAVRMRIERLDLDPMERHEMCQLLVGCASDVKRISRNLSPHVLANLGLEAALRSLCEVSSRYSGISFQQEYRDARERPTNGVSSLDITLYRVAQEGIANVLQHSQATEAVLRVQLGSDSAELLLQDNGRGFEFRSDHAGETATGGLMNMRRRVAVFGGQFRVQSVPGSGTELYLEIPLNGGESETSVGGIGG